MNNTTYASLAEEAVKRWKVDPMRAIRALGLIWSHPGTVVMWAKRDENDMPIEPGPELWIVRSAQGGPRWYFVRPGNHSCTCKDSRKGNICKHRIAVYIISQMHERRDAQTRADDRTDEILNELGF